MTEQWRPVVGYEGLYEVSDLGRVRSLPRVALRSNGVPYTIRERVLRPQRNSKHVNVTLYKDGVAQTPLVHRLVLAAFVGPCPPGQQARHWDDVGTNNTLSNLLWGTPSDNQHDMVRNGLNHNANKTHCPNGHEYTPENTYTKNSGRKCRICTIARSKMTV
jgi:hypothetical protein